MLDGGHASLQMPMPSEVHEDDHPGAAMLAAPHLAFSSLLGNVHLPPDISYGQENPKEYSDLYSGISVLDPVSLGVPSLAYIS